ncbi:MAG: LysR family transcriptional regulator [Paracoccaceae bacterium]
MQLYQIRYFLMICETGNVTQAAQKCNVSQPSMSRGIRKLEEELGDALFSRDIDGVRLTAFGTEMKPYFRDMLALEGELVERAKSRRIERSSTLTFGIMSTLGTSLLQPFLEKLLKVCANASLRFVDATGAELKEQMENGELDLCISGYFHLPKSAEAYRLYDEKYVVSFSKGHRFEAMKSVSIHQLEAEPYIRRLGCELLTTLPDMLHDGYYPSVDVRFASRHENMVQTMILAGIGCSIHPETMPISDGIYQRSITEDAMQRTVYLLVSRNSHSQALKRRVIQMAQTHEGFRLS